ncbi:MAG TPA: helicase-related protein, partial [Pyrinomonadaceae bacterium]|nr:helicase-related protein [Pyrinomonadaceae bacterium]
MIEWISEHDETNAGGASARFRIGRPLPEFVTQWDANREAMEKAGYRVFHTSDGSFVKIELGVIVSPPTQGIKCPKPPSFLRDFQIPHFENLWNVYSLQTAVGDFSDTGTGKTYVQIAMALVLDRPLFVLCPLAATSNWIRLIKKLGAKCICVGNYEYFKGDNPFGAMEIFYVPAKIFKLLSKEFCPFPARKAFSSYGECLDYLFRKSFLRKSHLDSYAEKTGKNLKLVSREIREYKWHLPPKSMLVFDEAHRCKSEKSQNMRLLTAAKPYVTSALTATPGITPRDFRALGYVLGMHNFYDFDLWTENHGCRRIYAGKDKAKFIGWDYSQKSGGLESLSQELFPRRAARMRVAEIPGFPETSITAEAFSADEAPELQKAYLACVSACEADVAGKKMIQVSAILKYRMLAEKLKVPLFISLIEEAHENGFSVAVFVNYKESMRLLHERFPEVPMVYGGQKPAEREAGRLDFFENKIKTIFLNVQAGGTAIDLHDIYGGHPRMSLISPTYNPYDLQQIFGRVHRDGALSK